MRLVNSDAGNHRRQVFGQEELEVVVRIRDLDPAQAYSVIPRILQTFDALTEAERGDTTLLAVPLAAVIDPGEVGCGHGTVRDGEVCAVVERISTHRICAAPARQQSDQLMPVHADDSTQATSSGMRRRCRSRAAGQGATPGRRHGSRGGRVTNRLTTGTDFAGRAWTQEDVLAAHSSWGSRSDGCVGCLGVKGSGALAMRRAQSCERPPPAG